MGDASAETRNRDARAWKRRLEAVDEQELRKHFVRVFESELVDPEVEFDPRVESSGCPGQRLAEVEAQLRLQQHPVRQAGPELVAAGTVPFACPSSENVPPATSKGSAQWKSMRRLLLSSGAPPAARP